jgi:hypothetical protein
MRFIGKNGLGRRFPKPGVARSIRAGGILFSSKFAQNRHPEYFQNNFGRFFIQNTRLGAWSHRLFIGLFHFTIKEIPIGVVSSWQALNAGGWDDKSVGCGAERNTHGLSANYGKAHRSETKHGVHETNAIQLKRNRSGKGCRSFLNQKQLGRVSRPVH